jgi:hypothetical protein
MKDIESSKLPLPEPHTAPVAVVVQTGDHSTPVMSCSSAKDHQPHQRVETGSAGATFGSWATIPACMAIRDNANDSLKIVRDLLAVVIPVGKRNGVYQNVSISPPPDLRIPLSIAVSRRCGQALPYPVTLAEAGCALQVCRQVVGLQIASGFLWTMMCFADGRLASPVRPGSDPRAEAWWGKATELVGQRSLAARHLAIRASDRFHGPEITLCRRRHQAMGQQKIETSVVQTQEQAKYLDATAEIIGAKQDVSNLV